MASAFSHAIAAVALGKISRALKLPGDLPKVTAEFWLLAMICAAIPDIDAIGFWLGVPYDSVWGHRGITHSFFFAGLLSFSVVLLFYTDQKLFSRSWWILIVFFFAATASHPILDAMTDGGKGVAFFAPFYDERVFLPLQGLSRCHPLA